jgi:hypothetical protein
MSQFLCSCLRYSNILVPAGYNLQSETWLCNKRSSVLQTFIKIQTKIFVCWMLFVHTSNIRFVSIKVKDKATKSNVKNYKGECIRHVNFSVKPNFLMICLKSLIERLRTSTTYVTYSFRVKSSIFRWHLTYGNLHLSVKFTSVVKKSKKNIYFYYCYS